MLLVVPWGLWLCKNSSSDCQCPVGPPAQAPLATTPWQQFLKSGCQTGLWVPLWVTLIIPVPWGRGQSCPGLLVVNGHPQDSNQKSGGTRIREGALRGHTAVSEHSQGEHPPVFHPRGRPCRLLDACVKSDAALRSMPSYKRVNLLHPKSGAIGYPRAVPWGKCLGSWRAVSQ